MRWLGLVLVASGCFTPPCDGTACVDGGSLAGGSASGGSVGGGSVGGGSVGGGSVGGGSVGGGSVGGGSVGGGSVGGGSVSDAGLGCPAGSLRILERSPVRMSAAIGCEHSRRLSVMSTCQLPQTLLFTLNSQVFTVTPPGPLSLPPGGAIDVELSFRPVASGQAQATLSVSNLYETGSIALEGTSAGLLTTERFPQPNAPAIDALLVISDGPGMSAAQSELAQAATSFISYAVQSSTNFSISVVRGAADGGGVVGPPLTPVTPNFSSVFATQVSLGQSGTPTSSCLSRAWSTLASSPFARRDRSLSVLCLQNTVEQLPGSARAWTDALRSLTDGGTVHVSSWAVHPPCLGPDDTRLSEAAMFTAGDADSICSPLSSSLGAAVFGRSASTTLLLSRPMEPDAGLRLRLDGVEVAPLTPQGDQVWTAFPPDRIVFAPIYALEPGRTLEVEFQPRCH